MSMLRVIITTLELAIPRNPPRPRRRGHREAGAGAEDGGQPAAGAAQSDQEDNAQTSVRFVNCMNTLPVSK